MRNYPFVLKFFRKPVAYFCFLVAQVGIFQSYNSYKLILIGYGKCKIMLVGGNCVFDK